MANERLTRNRRAICRYDLSGRSTVSRMRLSEILKIGGHGAPSNQDLTKRANGALSAPGSTRGRAGGPFGVTLG